MQKRPFKIAICAPFTKKDQKATLTWASFDKFSIDKAFKEINPSFFKRISTKNFEDVELSIEFFSLKSFKPSKIFYNCPLLKELIGALKLCQNPPEEVGGSYELGKLLLKKWPFLPITIEGLECRTTASKTDIRSESLIDEILKKVSIPENDVPPSKKSKKNWELEEQLLNLIIEILSAILNDYEFQKIEEAWRGLWFLIKNSKWATGLLLDIIPCDKENILESLEHYLTKNLNNLPNLILVDLHFNSSPHSIKVLKKLSELGEKFLIPIISSISIQFFNLDSWEKFHTLSYLPNYLDSSSFAKWKHLKTLESARWLTVLFNDFLLRDNYSKIDIGNDTHIELTGMQPLWGNPVWALGALCGKSIDKLGWPTAISRYGIIFLEDVYIKKISPNRYLATRIYLNQERIEGLVRCGIAPICSLYNQDSIFLPLDITTFGNSLSWQMLLASISHFILNLSDSFRANKIEIEDKDTLKELLTIEFNRFLNIEVATEPFLIDIGTKEIEKGLFQVDVIIKPPAEIINVKDPIVLNFTISSE